MKVKELEKQGKYVHRFKFILFNGGHGPTWGADKGRIDDEMDEQDKVFDSKAEFEVWYRHLQIGLAELDQAMNYCKYFVRTKGNEGNYVKGGKTFPAHGLWCGLHDFEWDNPERSYKPAIAFVQWLKANSWTAETWFELMDRYKI